MTADECSALGTSGCKAVAPKKYYVSAKYSVRGATQMKAELAKSGPIGCGVHASDGFEN